MRSATTFLSVALALLILDNPIIASSVPGHIAGHHLEQFDSSILHAGAALPPTVNTGALAPAARDSNVSALRSRRSEVEKLAVRDNARTGASLLKPRDEGDEGEDDEDCEEEEDDDAEDDDEECDEEEQDDGSDAADESASSAAEGKVAPTQVQINKVDVSSTASGEAPLATSTGDDKAPASSPAVATTNPPKLADQSYTVEDGCIRFHIVEEGEVCLGVLDGSKDLGLTLEDFYCLNPGLNEKCSNLETGTAYCTGYRK